MSNKRLIGYWLATGIICFIMGGGGVMDALRTDEALEIFARLGYPAYFAFLLGVAKLLGVVAILVPGFPRLKEWAYAGFTFDLLAAAASHAAVGDPAFEIAFPIAFLIPLAMSHAWRPPGRRL
jgi:uncharacterized membrane protein YphA (DoxX/SURF4 family)